MQRSLCLAAICCFSFVYVYLFESMFFFCHLQPFLFNWLIQAMFMPYDHRNTTPDGFSSHTMRSMLEDLNHRHCQNRCLVGSGGGSVGFVLSSQPFFSYSMNISVFDAHRDTMDTTGYRIYTKKKYQIRNNADSFPVLNNLGIINQHI